MADQDPNQDRQDRNMEVPGDTNSADIVHRTGEQMPQQSHDGLEDQRERDARSTRVNDEGSDQRSPDSDTSAGRHDNPRTGGIRRGGMGSERVVVHLTPMPHRKDFGLDAKVWDGSAAAARYAKALDVWERVVRDIARRVGSKKKKKY